jgi:uncharacterized protein GlcG (DUF336 family)
LVKPHDYELGRTGVTNISLSMAQIAIDASIAEARRLNLKPITVAILDAGGHLVALARENASSNLRPKIAIAKASGALALGVSSRNIGEMALERPAFISAASTLASEGLIPAAGGLLIQGGAGNVIGAIGVTGDTSDNDELCALAGIAAL